MWSLSQPKHLDGPGTMSDGEAVSIGDSIEHKEFDFGLIYRIARYHDHLGALLCVVFPNYPHNMLCLDLVVKLHSGEESPGGGSPRATQ